MSDANLTLAVTVDVVVEVWAENVTEEQLAAHIEGNPNVIQKAIEKLINREHEVEAGWVDEDNSAWVTEGHDAYVTSMKVERTF